MIVAELQQWADKIAVKEKAISDLTDKFSDLTLGEEDKKQILDQIHELEKEIEEYNVKLSEELEKMR